MPFFRYSLPPFVSEGRFQAFALALPLYNSIVTLSLPSPFLVYFLYRYTQTKLNEFIMCAWKTICYYIFTILCMLINNYWKVSNPSPRCIVKIFQSCDIWLNGRSLVPWFAKKKIEENRLKFFLNKKGYWLSNLTHCTRRECLWHLIIECPRRWFWQVYNNMSFNRSFTVITPYGISECFVWLRLH